MESSVTEHIIKMADSLAANQPVDPLLFYFAYLGINPHVEAFKQSDVSEFYNFLIDRMHSELVLATDGLHRGLVTFNDDSAISRLFKGTMVSQTTCMNCQESSGSESPFIDLSLEIPRLRIPLKLVPGHKRRFVPVPFTLDDCLGSFTETKGLAEDSQCGKCGHKNVSC